MANWAAGQVILGEYTIERELGRGGMGCVWLVKSNSTGRRFAVKQTILKDEKSRKAFLAELQTWIDLPEHPNIVPCRFFRTVGDEIVIFTDYIEGGSLKDWIDHGKLTTLEQILDVAIQFAWGLHAIHERGLIHQDVKPGNVLMTAEGVPMVADFGLARARLQAADGSFFSPALPPPGQHSILVPGAGLMTPQYASPEQRSGQPLSRKTDIWSWGVCMLDMFFGGVSCMLGGQYAKEILDDIKSTPDDFHGLPIPEEIDLLLSKCFQSDPNKRPSSFREVIKSFTATLGICVNETNENKLLSTDSRQWRALPNVYLYSNWAHPDFWHEVVRTKNIASPACDVAFSLASMCRNRAEIMSDVIVYDEIVRAIDSIARDNEESLIGCAVFYRHKSHIHSFLDDYSGAIYCIDRSLFLLSMALIDIHYGPKVEVERAKSFLCKAVILQNWGNSNAAAGAYQSGINHALEAKQSPEACYTLSLLHLNRGTLLERINCTQDAIAEYEGAVKGFCSMESTPETRGCLACALLNLGLAMKKHESENGSQEYSRARVEIMNSINACESDFSIQFLRFAAVLVKAHADMGVLCDCHDKFDEAVGHYDQAMAIHQSCINQMATQTGTSPVYIWVNKAISLHLAGNHKDALPLINQCIGYYDEEVYKRGKWNMAGYLAATFVNKGIILSESCDAHEAYKSYEEAISLYEKLTGEDGKTEFEIDLWSARMAKDMLNDGTGRMSKNREILNRINVLCDEGKWKM